LTPNDLGTIIFTPTCAGACNSPSVIQIPVLRKIGAIEGARYMCVNEQYLLRVPEYPGTTYDWSFLSGTATMTVSDQPNERYIRPSSTGTILVNVGYTNKFIECSGLASITIVATNKPIINGATKACKGTSQTYTLSGGVTGNWTIKKGSTIAATATGSNTCVLNTNTLGVGGYDVTVVPNNTCDPSPLAVEVIDQPAAPTSIVGNLAPCAGIPITYTAGLPLPGTMFLWTISGGVLSTTTGATVTAIWNTVVPVGGRVISVRRKLVSSSYCESINFNLPVGIPGSGATFTSAGSTFVSTQCSNTLTAANFYGVTLAGSAVAEDYTWSLSNPALGSIVSGQGTSAVQIQWNATAGPPPYTTALIVKIKQCNNISIQTSALITINAGTPVLTTSTATTSTTTGPISVCGGTPVSFSIGGITSFSGTINYGDLSPTGLSAGLTFPNHAYANITQSSSSKSVVVNLNNINGCLSATAQLNVTVNVLPTPDGYVNPPSDAYIPCTANSATLRSLTLNNGALTTNISYEWYYNNALIPGANLFQYTTPTGQFGSYKVKLTGGTTPNVCSVIVDAYSVYDNCSGGGPGGPGGPTGCVIGRKAMLTATPSCGQVIVVASFPPVIGSNNTALATNLTFSAVSSNLFIQSKIILIHP
jgi:hypothetical protein